MEQFVLSIDEKIKLLESDGYFDLRHIEGVGICGLFRYMFTIGVLINITLERPYEVRFCFRDLLSARSFFNEWDGDTIPTIGQDGCTAIK